MSDNILTIILGIIGAIVLAGLIYSKDAIIAMSIVPGVVTELENQGYMRQEIKYGKFVSTTQNEFAKNNPIKSEILKAYTDGFEDWVQSLKNSQNNKDEIEKLTNQIISLEKDYKILKELEFSRIQGYKDVLLFLSTNEEDKGKIILNNKNPPLAILLESGCLYKITAPSGRQLTIKAFLQPLKVNKQFTTKAVGRIYRNSYYSLFPGRMGNKGVGKAQIKINEGKTCPP